MRERMFFFKKYQNCGSINDEYGQCSSLSLKKNNTELHRHWLLREKKNQAYGKVSCILYFIINFICHMSTDIKSRTVENPKYTEHAKLSDDSI